MIAAPASARALNRAETRRLVQEAALRLAEERGFDGMSVGDIASASFMSTRTFFRHFDSKQDAIWSWVEDEMGAVASHVAAAPAALDDHAAVRVAVHRYAEDTASREATAARYVALIGASPSLAHLGVEQTAAAVVGEALARRTRSHRPTLEQRVLARAAAVAIAAAMDEYGATDAGRPLGELILAALRVALPRHPLPQRQPV